jgi:hypothetical protein
MINKVTSWFATAAITALKNFEVFQYDCSFCLELTAITVKSVTLPIKAAHWQQHIWTRCWRFRQLPIHR